METLLLCPYLRLVCHFVEEARSVKVRLIRIIEWFVEDLDSLESLWPEGCHRRVRPYQRFGEIDPSHGNLDYILCAEVIEVLAQCPSNSGRW